MLYAESATGGKVRAFPGRVAFCPCCDELLIPKCGEIKVWHWSHKGHADCDPWYESETPWHWDWKQLAPPERCEIPFNGHRADIVGKDGVVIELQHTSISPSEIREREQFYGAMMWLFDATGCRDRIDFRDRGNYYTFRWRWPRLHIAYTTCPTFLDLGDGWLFDLRKMYPNTPCGGWGYLVAKSDFVRDYLQG